MHAMYIQTNLCDNAGDNKQISSHRVKIHSEMNHEICSNNYGCQC